MESRYIKTGFKQRIENRALLGVVEEIRAEVRSATPSLIPVALYFNLYYAAV
jgi:hypothetical protein